MRSKLIAATATAAIAFLLVTNPVISDAADKITGKDIKNNSVTGKDVKESSLKVAKLAGKPASKYLNLTYTYDLVDTSPAALSKEFVLADMPAGSYLVSYSVFANLAGSGDSLSCEVRASISASSTKALHQYGSNFVANSTASASGYLKLTTAAPVIKCSSNGNFNLDDATTHGPSQITFTRLDKVFEGASIL